MPANSRLDVIQRLTG